VPLYEMTDGGLEERPAAGFAELGIWERRDLQSRLRDDISVLDDDLLVIAEEFGEWEDARRRIDLLAIDRAGRLVVIELKRTESGGHMDLQALRYAAMISSMGFAEVVTTYAAHCATRRPGEDVDARGELIEFLDEADGDGEPAIATDVRIVLVSADFGRELTTAVLWLNGFEGMDIRCVRIVPYPMDGKVLLDITQVIPLPETADYQVKLRRKEVARERARTTTGGRDLTKYHIIIDGEELPAQRKRHAVRTMVEALHQKGVALPEIKAVLPRGRKLRQLDGIHTPGEAVVTALVAQDPKVDAARWFSSEAWIDEATDSTWVLFSQWGTDTLPALTAMVAAFPQATVTFRPED
jgi:hypothetical protein